MIPTWKQKLLCTGCAAVLAAGLIPMAAWGGATEGSEPESATTFSAETPTNDAGVGDDGTQNGGKTETEGDAQSSNTNTPADGDQNGNGDGQGGGDGENGGNGDTSTSTPVEGDNQNPNGNTGEDNGQNNPTGTDGKGESTKATASGTEADSEDNTGDPTYADVKITSSESYEISAGTGTGISSFFDIDTNGYDAFDFDTSCESITSSDPSVVSVQEDSNHGSPGYGYYTIYANKLGSATITLQLKNKAPVSCKITVVADSDSDSTVDYADVEVNAPSNKVMYPTFVYGVIFDNAFQLNEAGDTFFGEHSIKDYIENITSSDPSVVKVEDSDDGDVPYIFVAQKPGTATLTLKLKDKPAVSYEVQVKSFNSIDLSKLKFTQKSLTLKTGESDWSIFFIEDYVNYEGLEDVEGLIVLGSSDYNVFNTYASEGSKVVAQRPGVATVGLYFYNPETDEHTLTDTMTVTVVAPAAIAGTTSGSDISGNILESNSQTDLMMKKEGVSLSVKIKNGSQLSAAQKEAIILVKDATGADKAIPVEISLVDKNGNVLTENDNNYCYTVRLKLEGELATLDPATIQVYYLGEDGEPEYITSWVEDGFLYLVTNHFSPYVIMGKTKDATSTTAPTTQASNKVAASKKQTVTATTGDTLPQAGDESTTVMPVVALSAAAAVAAIYLARRRMQE